MGGADRSGAPVDPDAGAVPAGRVQPEPAEASVLASLLDDPFQLDQVRGWLRQEDFTDPAYARAYQAMVALREQGRPVDAVTVMWEAHRRRALSGRRFGADDLLRLAGAGVPGFAAAAGREVLHAALRRTATRAAASITSAAMRPEVSPGRLVATGHRDLAEVSAVSDRWRAAVHPVFTPTM